MKSLKNRIQLIGRLGKDPEYRLLDNGRQLVNFSIATNDSYKKAGGERVEETQWHQVVAWGGLADVVDKYLKKGSEVALQGRLVHKNYNAPDGSKRYFSEVVADEILMMDKIQQEPLE